MAQSAVNASDFFAAVDEARERKYGAIDAHRQTVAEPRNVLPDDTAYRCTVCGGKLTSSRLGQRKKCNRCIANVPGTRRTCVVCGATERRSTTYDRKDYDYYCPDCRKVYYSRYDEQVRRALRGIT